MKKWIAAVVDEVLTGGAKRATKYVSPTSVVTATFHGKRLKGVRSQSVMVTVGKPNYAQREKIRKWKKIGAGVPAKIVVASMVLCLLPTLALAQSVGPVFWPDNKLAIHSTVMAMVTGPDKGAFYSDAGLSVRVYSFGETEPTAKIALLARVMQVEGQSPMSWGPSLLWIEPSVIKNVDLVFEVGAGNKITTDEYGSHDWGRIVGVAANWHCAKYSSIFAGAKIFDKAPGKIERLGVGVGAVIYADKFFASIWPGN